MADPVEESGRGAVRLSYRWWQADADEPIGDYAARIDLLYPVPPGGSVTLSWLLETPPQPGPYRLQVDLIHELVTRFGDQGADPLLVPVTVGSA